MEETQEQAGWKAILTGGHLPAVAVLCLGVWLHAANSMLTATTMPTAVAEMGGATLIGWAFALYQLGSIVAGAATALLFLRLGFRCSLVAAGLVYMAGCAISAVAPNMPVLLAGRLCQGFGGGFVVALTYIGLNRLFPSHLIPRLIALISTVWSASAFCGPAVGGGFANYGLWRMAFWAFCAQAAVFIVVVLLVIPKGSGRGEETPPALPVRRLVVLFTAVLLVAIAGADIDPVRSPLLCVASVGMFWLFFHLDARYPASRMFPSRPLDITQPVGAGLVLIFCVCAATMGLTVYGAFLLEHLHGVQPLTAGYIVAIESVGWGTAAVVFSGLSERGEAWAIRLGPALIALSLVVYAQIMESGPLWQIVLWAFLLGAGFGMMWGFIVRRVVATAREGEGERALAALPAIEQMGFAMGAAMCGIVANWAGFADGVTLEAARTVAFWLFAAFVPLALFGGIAAWRLAAARV